MSLTPRTEGSVALIGRPNVGKSTLFNLLTRTRKALVKNEPGVTRDVLCERAEWWGRSFTVYDTGGITEAQDTFSPLIKEQVLSVIQTFDLLVVIMDSKSGLVPEDRDIIRIAKESGRPFVIVVNKIDRGHEEDIVLSEFYEFGIDVIPAAFETSRGIDTVVEWVKENLPEDEGVDFDGVRLAIVGKPNVGKSSLCNYLMQEKRVLVSDQAGTTIDSVEMQFERQGQKFWLVDTAGLRKSARRKDGVEFLSAVKSHESIDKADLVLHLVDGPEGPSDQDTKVIDYCLEKGRPVILVANKSDLGSEKRDEYRKWFRSRVEDEFHFFRDIPVQFISAHTGSGIEDLFERVNLIWEKLHIKIPTSKLNDFFYQTIRQAPSPVYGTQNVKFYYLTQTGQIPPSFIAFANHPQGVTPSYRRFLTKRIQKEYGLEGIPIRMFIMKSGR